MSNNRLSSWKQYGAGLTLGLAIAGGAAFWSPWQQASAVPTVRDVHEMSVVFRDLAREVTPSIVSIETVTRAKPAEQAQLPFDDDAFPFRDLFRNDPRFRDMLENPRRSMTPRRSGAGSGFIIDASGVIMTNNHVVAGADEVKVRLHDGREFIATDIKTDPRTDIAIVRINDAGPLQALKMGDSRAMQVGDWVLAFGSPFGLEMTVTQGIISGTSRHRGIAEREDFLQTDAAINPGNSGGPLVNLKGEVIGINTAIASRSGGHDGVGFAVPTHIAGWVGDQLVSQGKVQRGYLGTSISPIDATTAAQFNVKVRDGVMVRAVLPKSPAEKAGLEPGDVIKKLDGQVVTDPPRLQGIVERLTIGQAYPVEVHRDGKRVTLNVTIEELPDPQTTRVSRDTSNEEAPAPVNAFGLELSNLTPNLARQLELDATTGVVVSRVEQGSLAAQAGVRAGDLIDRVGGVAVKTVDEFRAEAAKLSLDDGVVLHLRNAEGKRFVVLKNEN